MFSKPFSAILITALLQSEPVRSHRHGHKHLVDLGYAKHVPTYTNTTAANTTLLNYNNIRFAEPPIGSKRFRKPVTPPSHQRGIQNGNRSSWETDCIASAPEGVPFPALSGKSWGSEDCLFLNVVVPEGVKPGDKVPVLHWVVGSAYAFGSKDGNVFGIDTLGLFNKPLGLSDRFIVVTHNYRLGMTGWLPKLDPDMNGNVGVWDSLAALEWTKKHIHKFGGDPDNITAIGQSAGAAIINWLLLAQEGNMKLPFDQAFISSPGLAPRRNLERSRPVFNAVLNATGCNSVACMRRLPESKIKEANKALLDMIPNGGGGALGPGVGFTPLVDGELVSHLPLTAFELGKFNKGVKRVISGNTADEGLGMSADRDMPGRFPVIVRGNIPNVSNESIAKLQAMYSYPPDLPEKLAWDYTTDIVFGCAAANIAQAYGDKARRYLFSIPPAYHGAEMSYFFYARNETTPVQSLQTAEAAQSYLLQFMFRKDFDIKAQYAGPLSAWPSFAAKDTAANITNAGFEFGKQDELVARRCAFINELLRDPKNGV